VNWANLWKSGQWVNKFEALVSYLDAFKIQSFIFILEVEI
jgi:hypothetical protein